MRIHDPSTAEGSISRWRRDSWAAEWRVFARLRRTSGNRGEARRARNDNPRSCRRRGFARSCVSQFIELPQAAAGVRCPPVYSAASVVVVGRELRRGSSGKTEGRRRLWPFRAVSVVAATPSSSSCSLVLSLIVKDVRITVGSLLNLCFRLSTAVVHTSLEYSHTCSTVHITSGLAP